MSRPLVTLIAALGENREIGQAGGLPWRLPDDLKRFKRRTTGGILVMGRRTFESGDPLPGRVSIVVTSQEGYAPDPGAALAVETARSVDEALARARRLIAPGDVAEVEKTEEIFIAGGTSVFAAALPTADRLDLTHVHATFPEADTCFPEIDWADWKQVAREEHPADDRHAVPFTFATYERG